MNVLEKLTGPIFERLAVDKRLIRVARAVGLPLGGTLFVGGQTIDETFRTVRTLNAQGRAVTIDCLGEFIHSVQDAKAIADECIDVLYRLEKEQVDGQISLKLTSVGVRLDPELALMQMERILEVALQLNRRVTINMEEYEMTESILKIFRVLQFSYPNLGVALQANLHRSRFDLDQLEPMTRIVKGAYTGSKEHYIEDKAMVDANYLLLVKLNLMKGRYTQIATHDDDMIEELLDFIRQADISDECFEFQMLQGMRPQRQKELVNSGYRVVVYVPHGVDWYTYLMRRLAERPANIGFTLLSMLRL